VAPPSDPSVSGQASVAVPPSADELSGLAEELGLAGGSEAVLLVYSVGALDVLRVGARLVAPESPEPGKGARQIVRGLSEGIVAIELSAAGRSWEGQIQVYKGAVNLLDADTLLLTSGSAASALEQAEAAFDLFTFYDELDFRAGVDAKLAYCTEVLAGTLVGPDRTLVARACARFERKKQDELRREEELARLVEHPDALVDALKEADAEDDPESTSQLQLYKPDGTLRTRPRGSIARSVAGASALTTGGASIAGALYWEYRAQQEYLLFRNAEQFGDDTQMTEHLYYTQQHDKRRDAAIGIATTAITAGVVAIVLQKIASERFRKARAAMKGSAEATEGAGR